MKIPKLVLEEAINLRKFATKNEIVNLDFSSLDPENFRSCIYGQMTGDCFNSRAQKLIEQCAKRVYDNTNYDSEGKVCEGVKLNGSPKKMLRIHYFSPIEVFISKNPGKEGAGKLIQFIKGKIKSL